MSKLIIDYSAKVEKLSTQYSFAQIQLPSQLTRLGAKSLVKARQTSAIAIVY